MRMMEDTNKRVDEFMTMARENQETIRKQMEMMENMRKENAELRAQLNHQQQQQQQPPQQSQRPGTPNRAASRQSRPQSRNSDYPPLDSHATGPVYRPQPIRNKTREQIHWERFNNAQSGKELAELSIRREFAPQNNNGAPPPPRATSIKSCY
ncbi:hypothetical protein HDU81_001768, partial [Chytriomyces hyalinus]